MKIVGRRVFAYCMAVLHFPWIPAPYRGTGPAFDRRNAGTRRLDGIHSFSYQSLRPAAASTLEVRNLGRPRLFLDSRILWKLRGLAKTT